MRLELGHMADSRVVSPRKLVEPRVRFVDVEVHLGREEAKLWVRKDFPERSHHTGHLHQENEMPPTRKIYNRLKVS